MTALANSRDGARIGSPNCAGHAPRTAADRMRTSRARQRAGTVMLRLEVPAAMVSLLLRKEWITPDEQRNPAAIGEDLLLLVESAAPHLKNGWH